MSRPADDAELAQRAKDGDEGAYAELVQRQAPRIAAYLGTRIRRPEVVDALLVETIDAGWRYLHKYRPPQSLSAWFRGLAAEVARFWRREHPDEPLRGPFPRERCGPDDDPELLARVHAALEALDQKLRGALEHRFRGGLEGAQLADALHLDASADAERLVERAIAALARALAGQRESP